MQDNKKVLVVDGNGMIRDSYRQILERSGFEVEEAADGEAAVTLATEISYHLILLELRLPGIDGIQTLARIKAANPITPVVMITGYPSIEASVEAMKYGAADFIPKPFTPGVLRFIINKILKEKHTVFEHKAHKNESLQHKDRYTIIGENARIRSIHEMIKKIAPTDCTVLITGESGTGKELFARALHHYSDRADKPFVVVDCGAIVGTLFESELFGYTKGAFTGANATTRGRFEYADGGTVFLDEIGTMDPSMQIKLLRVIQEREFTRIGSNQVVRVNVRIIAATNIDILEAVKAGAFREDLYYRLCVMPILLPPLREHKDDIPLLARYFLEKYARLRKKKVTAIAEDAIQALMTNDWPGNVRELENIMERAVILATGETITRDDILYHMPSCITLQKNPFTLKSMESVHIMRVLKQVNGNKILAARHLDIDRKTLWRKMKEYGIKG